MPPMPPTVGAEREAFWTQLAAARPDLGITPGVGWDRTLHIPGHPHLRLRLSLSQDRTSVYLTAATPLGATWMTQNLREVGRVLGQVVGAATGEAAQGRWFRRNVPLSVTQRSQWQGMIDFLSAQQTRYTNALAQIPGAP